jgi:hypothetical protein
MSFCQIKKGPFITIKRPDLANKQDLPGLQPEIEIDAAYCIGYLKTGIGEGNIALRYIKRILNLFAVFYIRVVVVLVCHASDKDAQHIGSGYCVESLHIGHLMIYSSGIGIKLDKVKFDYSLQIMIKYSC